jgi:hypothetical protein
VIDAVDESTSYGTAQDLAATILTLIQSYRTSGVTWINTFDPSPDRNPGDHRDHAVVGWMTQLATLPLQLDVRYAYFEGYALTHQSENLSQATHDLKLDFFGGYYFALLDVHDKGETELCAAPANEQTYAAYLWRQYFTLVQ